MQRFCGLLTTMLLVVGCGSTENAGSEPDACTCSLSTNCDSSQTVLPETVLELDDSVTLLAVDEQYVFLANTLPAALYRFRRSDGDLQTLVSDSDHQYRILDLVVTPTDVVWSQSPVGSWEEGGSVLSMPRAGGETVTLTHFPQPYAECSRIAVRENQLYCARSVPGSSGISVYDLDAGGPPTPLLHEDDDFHPTKLVLQGDVLVWQAHDQNGLARIGVTPVDGSASTILAFGVSSWGLTVHDDHVYIGNEEGLWSVPLHGPPIAPLCVAEWSRSAAGVNPIGVVDGELWYLRCPIWYYNDLPSHTGADRLASLALAGAPHRTHLCLANVPDLDCEPTAIGPDNEVFLLRRSYQHTELQVVHP